MIRIAVVDDNEMIRKQVKRFLNTYALKNSVVFEIYTYEDGHLLTLDINHEMHFDLIYLDIEMPIKTGLDVLEWIRANQSETKVVIVTTFKRKGYFKRALAAQVDAYVLKERSISDLMATIHTVLAGHKEYSPELVEGVAFDNNPLSQREQEVLAMVAQGSTNQEIAESLFLSNGTIRNYMTAILTKLDAGNRTDAVRIAKEKDWLG